MADSQGIVNLNTMVNERIKIDRSELIEYVRANNAPYYVLYSMLGFEGCSAEKFEFFKERSDFEDTLTVSAAGASGATTINLVGGANRVVGSQLLMCRRTGEHFIVASTPTADTAITVICNIGGEGSSALLAGDVLFIGPTVMEYSSKPVDTISKEPTTDYNYIEKNRKGWKVDGRAQAIATYGPAALAYAKEDNVRAFMREQEFKFLFGVRSKRTDSGKTRTLSGGVNYFMTKSGSSAYIKDFTGKAITRDELDNTLMEYFSACGGPENKMVLCGWNLVRIINGFGRDLLTVNDKYEKVGLTVRKYQSDFGSINLMPHDLWNKQGGYGMRDEAWILDLDSMKRRGLSGRSDITMVTTRGQTELQDAGEDALHQELTVEDGLEVRNTHDFAKFTGIQA